MNVKQLIEKLSKYPPELNVFVHDGMDPSDLLVVTEVRHEQAWVLGKKINGIFITPY